MARPADALVNLRQLLRPEGTITVIEGDHGSAYFHPDSDDAHATIQSLVRLQREGGGNGLIGRQLYPLLVESGFDAVRVSPRMVYADASRPDLGESGPCTGQPQATAASATRSSKPWGKRP